MMAADEVLEPCANSTDCFAHNGSAYAAPRARGSIWPRWSVCCGWLLLAAVVALAGCQAPPPKAVVIPPPINMYQQLLRLNARASALNTLRVVGTLKLHYLDRQGNAQDYQAHGVLLIDQNLTSKTSKASRRADLLLVATYLGQDAFEFGMNAREYWMIDHHNKQAWVGRRSDAVGNGQAAVPFRPQRLLHLLAITPLFPSLHRQLAMTVAKEPPQNRVFVIAAGSDGAATIERQIVISRETGLVQGVLMFNRAGERVATAVLGDYHRVAVRGGNVTADSPRFPFQIAIDFAAQHSQLRFDVDSASLTLRVKPRYAFASPSLAGLKVQELAAPQNGQ